MILRQMNVFSSSHLRTLQFNASKWSIFGNFSRLSSKTGVMSLEELKTLLAQSDGDESGVDRKRELLRIEWEYRSYMGEEVPSVITEEMMHQLSSVDSEFDRQKLWQSFANFESVKREANREKQQHLDHVISWRAKKLKTALEEQGKVFDGALKGADGRSIAGPIMSRLFSRIDEKAVKASQLLRYGYSFQFGQSLVFDFDVPSNMTYSQRKELARHLNVIYNCNSALWEPFHLFLCGLNRESSIGIEIKNQSELHHDYRLNQLSPTSPTDKLWTSTSKCVTDLFDRDKLVYLTPKSENRLKSFSHDDVYVISALSNQLQPHTCLGLPKAKELGVRTAQLDLDRFFNFRSFPNFNILSVFLALMDARGSENDWPFAFRRLPRTRMVEWSRDFGYPSYRQKILNERLKSITMNDYGGNETDDDEAEFNQDVSTLIFANTRQSHLNRQRKKHGRS